MTAIILAGGKSSRMGFDKAFLKIDGIPLIKRQIKSLKTFFKKIIVVTNNPHKYRIKSVKVVRDIVPGQGPLGGIYSGLMASGSFHNFIIACDMPFVNTGLIKYMHKRAAGYDVVIPRNNNRYEPLFCIYSKNCLAHIERSLDKRRFKISGFFPQVRVRKITNREVSRFASPEAVFTNVNTIQDLGRF